MDIDYRGANCVVIKSKNGVIITDPTENVGKIKELSGDSATVIASQDGFAPSDASFVINMPGEYERNNISILGIPVQRHIDPEGKSSTMYRIVIDGVRIAVIGHVASPLSDEDLESFGMVDIAIVPVGGGGYTLDARDAAAIVRQLDPKIVIPTHYSDASIKYEVPQEKLEEFIKELAGIAHDKVDNLKIKNGQLSPIMTIYELKKK